jgi:hypothetical protein
MTLRRRYEIGFALIFRAATLSTQPPSTQFDAGLIRATVDSLASIIRGSANAVAVLRAAPTDILHFPARVVVTPTDAPVMSRAYGEPDTKSFTLLARSN